MIILQKLNNDNWEKVRVLTEKESVIKNGVLEIKQDEIDLRGNYRLIMKNNRTTCILKCQIKFIK